MFLFPLIWTAVASVSAAARHRPGQRLRASATTRTWLNYQAGIWPSTSSTRAFVALLTVALTLFVSSARRLRLRPVPVPRQEPAVPADAGDPDGAVRDDADPALRHAQRARPAELADRPRLVLMMFQLPFADVHDAQHLRVRAARAGGGGAGRRLHHLRRAAGGSCCPRCSPGSSPSACSRSWPPGTSSSPR